MAKEVEIKAFLTEENRAMVLCFLQNHGKFLGETNKKDVYFRKKNGQEKTPAFRLRNENGKCWVTQKERNISPLGVEMNTEREFEIVNEKNFLRFANAAGFEEWYTKEKKTLQFEQNGMHAEMVFLPPLGNFLEVEILCEEAEMEASAEKIFQFFSHLQLEHAIEKKPYFVLLQEKNAI